MPHEEGVGEEGDAEEGEVDDEKGCGWSKQKRRETEFGQAM